jgi:spore cortex formation protein SpoVR/YcgB (stage V sporulation)
MEWLKGQAVMFHEGINPYCGKEYILTLLSTPSILQKYALTVSGSVIGTLDGHDSFIYNNVMLRRSNNDINTYDIVCSDAQRLSKFIQEQSLVVASMPSNHEHALELYRTIWDHRG